MQTALAGCLVAIVAACSGIDGDTEPTDELTDYQAVYLGLGEDGLEAAIDRDILTSQQADVAACMAGGGFEYSPLPPESFAAVFDGPPRTSAEFAEGFGFFIATQPEIEIQIATATWPCNAEYWRDYRTIVAASGPRGRRLNGRNPPLDVQFGLPQSVPGSTAGTFDAAIGQVACLLRNQVPMVPRRRVERVRSPLDVIATRRRPG